MARYPTSYLKAKLLRFANMHGLQVSPGFRDGKFTPGSIDLERGSMGGWHVVQYVNTGGAQRHLTGHCNNLTAAELVAWFEGAEWSFNQLKGK